VPETIPVEADSVMTRLLTLLGVTPVANGQIIFDFGQGLIVGVRPQPVHRFKREKDIATSDRRAHTHPQRPVSRPEPRP
jgi:hypothetical protein